jgi:hypothetical protein
LGVLGSKDDHDRAAASVATGLTALAAAAVAFAAPSPPSTFECKADKKPFKPCMSPKKVKRLDEGRHKFKVRATDAAGNVDPTPDKDRFRVVG